MELWYIAWSSITQRYYLQRASRNKDVGVYHWIGNRYRAMFFYSELSIGGYINTYMASRRDNTDLGVICFKNGKESQIIPILDFGDRYQKALYRIVLT